jgi:hypothetical protein
MTEGRRCYICDRGELIRVAPSVWNCSRSRCNNQFFHDDDGTLNVRDKPRQKVRVKFKTGGVIPGRMDRLPTVNEIITVLGMPGAAAQCWHIHRDKPRERLPEVWIERLGVWLREDGWSYSGDMARGYAYPGLIDRWRLRRAIRKNRQLIAVELEG